MTTNNLMHFLKVLGGGAISGSTALLGLQDGFMAHIISVLPAAKPWMLWVAFGGAFLHGAGTSIMSLVQLLQQYFPQWFPTDEVK